jgi:hypothetical protein
MQISRRLQQNRMAEFPFALHSIKHYFSAAAESIWYHLSEKFPIGITH